jgi:hypothetical protein
MWNRKIRGVPLLAILLIGAGVAVYAAAFSPWNLVNNLVQPTAPPATYAGETKTFLISVAGEDDMAKITITLSGNAQPNAQIVCTIKLEILKPDTWLLNAGCIITTVVRKPDNSILTTFNNPIQYALGKGAAPDFEEFSEQIIPTVAGQYSITPSITGMVWTN